MKLLTSFTCNSKHVHSCIHADRSTLVHYELIIIEHHIILRTGLTSKILKFIFVFFVFRRSSRTKCESWLSPLPMYNLQVNTLPAGVHAHSTSVYACTRVDIHRPISSYIPFPFYSSVHLIHVLQSVSSLPLPLFTSTFPSVFPNPFLHLNSPPVTAVHWLLLLVLASFLFL